MFPRRKKTEMLGFEPNVSPAIHNGLEREASLAASAILREC